MDLIRTILAGLRDGWTQPHELSTSTNVDDWGAKYETLDRAISVGQFLRAGRRSEAWEQRYWPFSRIPH